MYDKFAEIATTVYLSVDGSDYLNDFSRNLDVLGKIFGKEDFVKENLDNLTKQMDEVKAMAQKKNVNALTTMVSEGNLSVFSDKSRFGLIYNQLGITNKDETIEESNHGQQVTFEYLAEQNPEYIFVAGPFCQEASPAYPGGRQPAGRWSPRRTAPMCAGRRGPRTAGPPPAGATRCPASSPAK